VVVSTVRWYSFYPLECGTGELRQMRGMKPEWFAVSIRLSAVLVSYDNYLRGYLGTGNVSIRLSAVLVSYVTEGKYQYHGYKFLSA